VPGQVQLAAGHCLVGAVLCIGVGIDEPFWAGSVAQASWTRYSMIFNSVVLPLDGDVGVVIEHDGPFLAMQHASSRLVSSLRWSSPGSC
jgi:hypothetical protein